MVVPSLVTGMEMVVATLRARSPGVAMTSASRTEAIGAIGEQLQAEVLGGAGRRAGVLTNVVA
jgi:hypothetical protein